MEGVKGGSPMRANFSAGLEMACNFPEARFWTARPSAWITVAVGTTMDRTGLGNGSPFATRARSVMKRVSWAPLRERVQGQAVTARNQGDFRERPLEV